MSALIPLLTIYYFLLCIVTAIIATTRDRKGSNWFFLSIILTPAFAMLVLLSFEDLSLIDPSIQIKDMDAKIDKYRELNEHDRDRILREIDELSTKLNQINVNQ